MKCSDQFRVIKGVTDCFKYLYVESTKPSVNVKVSRIFEFSYRPQVFDAFYRGEGRCDRTDRMG